MTETPEPKKMEIFLATFRLKVIALLVPNHLSCDFTQYITVILVSAFCFPTLFSCKKPKFLSSHKNLEYNLIQVTCIVSIVDSFFVKLIPSNVEKSHKFTLCLSHIKVTAVLHRSEKFMTEIIIFLCSQYLFLFFFRYTDKDICLTLRSPCPTATILYHSSVELEI